MSAPPKHSVSVAGVVIDDQDRVLVIRRADNGHWEPPGGVLELDETFEEGVVREVAEETGMRVTVQELSGVYKNTVLGVVALVFRCTPSNDPLRTSDETTDVRWMTRDEAAAAMDPAFAIRVADAFVPGANIRAHDGVRLTSS